MLSDWMCHELIPSHSVIIMSKLLEKCVLTMNFLRVSEIKRSTKTQVR